jgi:type IV secretion system protein VirB10
MSFVESSAQEQPREQANPGADARIDGDRGIPSVNSKRRTSLLARVFYAVLVLFGVALIAVSVWTLYKKYGAPVEEKSATLKASNQIKNSQPLNFGSAQALPANEPVPLIKRQPEPAQSAAQVRRPNAQPQRPAPVEPEERRLSKGMKFAGNEDSTAASPSPPSPGNAATNNFGQLLSSTKTPMATASILPDQNFLLTKGTIVDCIAQQAIDTTQPGMLDCIGSSDVYSKSNKVVLLERGTIYNIEYQRALSQGQNRVFLLSSRAVTPNNVAIDLDSPVTDALGRAGLDGTVNTHFWTRFGGAILLGLIADIGQAAVNRASRDNGQITVQNTTRAGQDAASRAIEATIDVPPTLEHNQGAHIKLYVARDLDFRSVYELAARP